MLTAGPAESGRAFVSTKEFTLTHNIESIGQIIPIESTVTIAAEPGFEMGDSGRATLKRIYAVKNWKFLAIRNGNDQKSVDALLAGKAQIVLMDASSPLIESNNLVIIADPNYALPADNLIPIMASETYPAEIRALVDSVSQALTTEQLQFLTAKRVADNAPSDRQIARDWLAQNRLLGPGSARS
jgi:osmoprotectant transport system substrate-binding protein